MATQDELSVVSAEVSALSEKVDALLARINADPDSQCSADLPHDALTFIRGRNVYMCRCGKVYEKNNQYGLREA